jgi:hypothetical protein
MSIAPSTQGGKKKRNMEYFFFFYPLVWPLKGKKKKKYRIFLFLIHKG